VNRSSCPDSVRYMSVTTALQGLTAAHRETQRDNSKAARVPGYAQATGRFRRWWQCCGGCCGRCWVRTNVGLADGLQGVGRHDRKYSLSCADGGLRRGKTAAQPLVSRAAEPEEALPLIPRGSAARLQNIRAALRSADDHQAKVLYRS
jgi:hypothetical protein